MRPTILVLPLALAFHGAPLAAATAALTPASDTTLFEENGDASDAKGPGLFTGRNTLTFRRRALLLFDVAGVLPAGSTITAARLEMTLTRSQGNPVDVLLFRVSAPWGEGSSDAGAPGGGGAAATPGDATWTKRVWPATAWAAVGGDTSSTASATAPIATSLGLWTWGSTAGIVADVQGWLDSPATNFGWQMRADELQAAPSARRWASRESAAASDRPRLVITYTAPGPAGRPADDVPALSGPALLGLGAALAALGALALRKGPAPA